MSQTAKLSPALQQYLKIKSEYPGTLLFYHMGDFYELFFEDAKKISRLLNLTLTKRGTANGTPVPMAGVPIHAADNYISKLVRMGESIVICNQVADAPATGKGIVERKITRVITPGTLTEDTLLEEGSDNLIIALHPEQNISALGEAANYGMAILDVSSGRFTLKELRGDTLLESELLRLNPAECIISEETVLPCTPRGLHKRVPWMFDLDTSQKLLCEQFQVHNLDGFGCSDMHTSIGASGALLQYVQEMQKSSLPHIQNPQVEQDGNYIFMDANSRACLEINSNLSGGSTHTLVGIYNHTRTAMGARCLARWFNQPLRQGQELNNRQESVTALLQSSELLHLREELKQLADIERICARLALCQARPRDLLGLRDTLAHLPSIKNCLTHIDSTAIQALDARLRLQTETVELLQGAIIDPPPATIRDGGVIRNGYDAELDGCRNSGQGTDKFLLQLEADERNNTRASNLKISYNRIHHYYIEIPKRQGGHIPEHYRRIQTLKNAERYTTPELSELGEKISHAHEHALAREKQLYQELQTHLHPKLSVFQQIAETLAHLDVFATFAWCASQYNYACPRFSKDLQLSITAGRHPVVERFVEQEFVPNDTEMNEQRQILVITGPNMGGKSTYMRQVAHIVLLAHIGAYIPAESACIGPIHQILTRIGATDDIASGRSTFMVEMTETANILNNANQHSLVIMDEIGRGTSTFDGLSLAWACAQSLALNNRSLTLFATHYFELTHLANKLKNVHNMHMDAIEHQQQIVFLHRICEGAANQSYGIHVARLAGIPDQVIEVAQSKLRALEAQQLRASYEAENAQIALPLDDIQPPRAESPADRLRSGDLNALESLAQEMRQLKLDQMNAKEALDTLYRLQLLLLENKH